MLIATRCVIFLSAFAIVAIGALNVTHLLRMGEILHFGTAFGVFQIAVALAALVYATRRRRNVTRQFVIGGATMIALERIWTVAGPLDVGWGAADWLMFVAVVMLPPFAMMGASLLLPLAQRSVITDCEETRNA